MTELTTAVASLDALAHPDRLRAFRLLVAEGPSGLPSGGSPPRSPCRPRA